MSSQPPRSISRHYASVLEAPAVAGPTDSSSILNLYRQQRAAIAQRTAAVLAPHKQKKPIMAAKRSRPSGTPDRSFCLGTFGRRKCSPASNMNRSMSRPRAIHGREESLVEFLELAFQKAKKSAVPSADTRKGKVRPLGENSRVLDCPLQMRPAKEILKSDIMSPKKYDHVEKSLEKLRTALMSGMSRVSDSRATKENLAVRTPGEEDELATPKPLPAPPVPVPVPQKRVSVAGRVWTGQSTGKKAILCATKRQPWKR